VDASRRRSEGAAEFLPRLRQELSPRTPKAPIPARDWGLRSCLPSSDQVTAAPQARPLSDPALTLPGHHNPHQPGGHHEHQTRRCDHPYSYSPPPRPPADPTTPAAAARRAAPPPTRPPRSSKAETKTIPNLVGKGLQTAQDEAQSAGFYNLDSHDSLGRDRNQILDRDWKVCTQTPAAGKTAPTDTKLDFGTVKLDETCPAKDQAEPSAVGGKMPNLAGKSVKAARAALDSSTSITVTDATGDSRMILVESNWQVCSQDPAPGKALNGQPVEFTAVKFGESCP
jgi:beta-lactam-binding protein with PASTA domain